MAVRTWVWVVIGLVIVCIVGLLAVAGMGVYFVARQVDTEAASPARAEEAFERERGRFKDQKPVIEIDDDDNVKAPSLEALEAIKSPGERRRLDNLSILAWDADEERLVRIDVPFWLLRLKEDPLDILADSGIRGERIRITIEDIERMGPRLLIDHRGRRGDRVLVWTQ